MSKIEPDEYINDRYKAIEDRLAVGIMDPSPCRNFSRLTHLRNLSSTTDCAQEAEPAPDAG